VQPIVKTVPIDTTLLQIADAIKEEVISSLDPNNATFILTFPRRTFKGDELKVQIQELGLVPSGSLILQM